MAEQELRNDDLPADEGADVIRSIRMMREEADSARLSRIRRNEANVEAYLGQIDFSDKAEGQSTEHVPKVASSIEQFTAFIKRGLTQTGPDWFTVRMGADAPADSHLTALDVRALMVSYLDNLPFGRNGRMPFSVLLSDAIKMGLLESLVIFKVHGSKTRKRGFVVERGNVDVDPETGRLLTPEPKLKRGNVNDWELRIDLIPPNEYYPDPTGRGLYEIHRVERDISDVIAMGKAGIYDMEVVNQLVGMTMAMPDEEDRDADMRNQDEESHPSFRKTVVIDEFWGDILDEKGLLIHENVVAAIANDRFLVRPPEPNPLWHGESPFVCAPLLRVPGSVWHRALYDDAVKLNEALDELFNLMLDGGLASVWGVRQLRADFLESTADISGGIPQGTTLMVGADLPPNQKVLETVTSGEIPGDAITMYNMIEREFNFAALTNDLKMGALPQRQVKATEIIESSQSQAATLDGIVSDIEQQLIEPLLRKCWLMILQNADDLSSPRVKSILGSKATLALAQMPAAERFARFAGFGVFEVNGLSATMARSRDFQKFAALLQIVSTNPMLLEAFFRSKDPDKIVDQLFKIINLNPRDFEISEEMRAMMQERLQSIQQVSGIAGPQRASRSASGNMASQDTGGPEVPGEVNQMVNPMTGFTGN